MADRRQGRRIAEVRERRGLSQEEVARRVGVSTSGYQKWELGGGIRGQNLRRLAEVLDVSLLTITGEAEPADPFNLAMHLDPQIEEFRISVADMQGNLAAIAERLEQVISLLEAISSAMPEPDELVSDAARSIEQAGRARAAGRGAGSADRRAGGDRRGAR